MYTRTKRILNRSPNSLELVEDAHELHQLLDLRSSWLPPSWLVDTSVVNRLHLKTPFLVKFDIKGFLASYEFYSCFKCNRIDSKTFKYCNFRINLLKTEDKP